MPKRQSQRSYRVPTRAAKPEVNAVLRRLRNLGMELEFMAGAGHWRVIDPGSGASLTTVSNTPSDVNFWKHIKRAVEKAGYNWEGRPRRRAKRTSRDVVAGIDLEALAYAQRMARIHGQREPQLEDFEDTDFVAKLRRGFTAQETKEAIDHMAQGVESARAHRVVSRLLYLVEQRGAEMATRARERNPKIREGGVIHELIHVSQDVAKKRGLRYWKTPESAWQSIYNFLNGKSEGMTVWVANLLEATMDELDGLRWDNTAAAGAATKTQTSKTPREPSISNEEAQQLILATLTSEFQNLPLVRSSLVPEKMSQYRFDHSMRDLIKAGHVEREREPKKQGSTMYRLAPTEATVTPEPTPVEPAPTIIEEPPIEAAEPTTDEEPMPLPPEHPARSVLQAMIGGSMADRYFDTLLNLLSQQVTNGVPDWQQLEPLLTRLDKLAGIGAED